MVTCHLDVGCHHIYVMSYMWSNKDPQCKGRVIQRFVGGRRRKTPWVLLSISLQPQLYVDVGLVGFYCQFLSTATRYYIVGRGPKVKNGRINK